MDQLGLARRRGFRSPSMVALLIALVLVSAVSLPSQAQEVEITLVDEVGAREILLQALVEDAGDNPLELRILRMTLEPGGRSPWHSHSGLEFGVVESGTLRVQVDGPAVIRPADAAADAESQQAPQDLDISLSAGDRIAYAPGTGMTFENAGTEPVVLLAATVFPSGPGAPAASSFFGPTPTASEQEGVSSVILGQAVVESPAAGSVVVFEKVEIDAGDRVPAFPGPVLMALEEGAVAGSVRAQAGGAPGDSTAASSEDVEFSLDRGEAVFFSSGMSDAPLDGDGRIVILRLGVLAGAVSTTPESEADAGATATAAPEATEAAVEPAPTATAPAGENQRDGDRPLRTITVPETPAPEPAAETAAEPDEATAPETASDAAPADEDLAGLYPPPGTVLMVNDNDVRIRAEPTTNGEILAGLSLGQLVVVLGEPVDADGYIWYPVQDVTAPELQGWVAAPYLDLANVP